MIAFEIRQDLFGSVKEATHLIRLIEEPFTFPCHDSRNGCPCLAVRKHGYTERLNAHEAIVFDDTFAPPKLLFGSIPIYILRKHERCPRFYQEDRVGIIEVATGRIVMGGMIP